MKIKPYNRTSVVAALGSAIALAGIVTSLALAQVGPSAPAVSAASMPPPPADPAGAAAYEVLDRHCAGCHQAGRTASERVHGGIANILSLDALAREATLVRPGEPDASALFHAIFTGHAPRGVFLTAQAGEPRADEVAAVRDWIRQLPSPGADPACSGRPHLGPRHAAEHAVRALAQAGPRAGHLRFVSLAHLHDACATDAELAAYRQAVRTVVNSLSWSPAPVRTEAIDTEQTVLQLDLEALGWSRTQWDDLLKGYPLARLPAAQMAAETVELAGTSQALVNGDWLAAALMSPAAYAPLLGLPADLTSLKERLGPGQLTTVQAGGLLSRETEAERKIERRSAGERAVWIAEDRLPGSNVRSTRLAFELPNGFTGFAMFDGNGVRLETSPIEPAAVRQGGAPATSASLQCLSCHATGPRTVSERAAADRARLSAGQLRMGLDPALSISGQDAVSALASRYFERVSLLRAAAELGFTVRDLERTLLAATGPGTAPARRLLQGIASRDDALAAYAVLLQGGPGGADALPATGPRPLTLTIWPDAASYRVGEAAIFHAEASEACHLTLVSVDTRGRATVLFPNDFEPNNALRAGQQIAIPGPEEPYRFRLTERGRETLVGICTRTARPIDTIRHDFERLRFTVLGDWLDFQDRAYELANRPPPAQPRDRQVRRRGQPATDPPVAERRGLEPQARTAVGFEVR